MMDKLTRKVEEYRVNDLRKLKALAKLLIQKGIFTKAELKQSLQSVQVKESDKWLQKKDQDLE